MVSLMPALIVALTLLLSALGGWTIAHADAPQQRVRVLAYEPTGPDGRALAETMGWQDARTLTDSLVDALGRAGRDYWIVERRTIGGYAPGSTAHWTPGNWRFFCGSAAARAPMCYWAGQLDVEAVLRQADRPVDEVWLVTPPWTPEAREFYLAPNRPKLLILNQERRLAEALESYGHMTEATLGLLDMQGPVHRPPGSTRPYQYDGPGCAAWGCNPVGYLEWWLSSAQVYQAAFENGGDGH